MGRSRSDTSSKGVGKGRSENGDSLVVSAEKKTFSQSFAHARERVVLWKRRQGLKNPHKAFRRSYREDYVKPSDNRTGYLVIFMRSVGLFFRNWRTTFLLVLGVMVVNIALGSLMSEETYRIFQETLDQTEESLGMGEVGTVARGGLLLLSVVLTGGLSSGLSEANVIFAVIGFLAIWLVSTYLARFWLAGKKIKLREALYNAGAPIVPAALVLLVVVVYLLPIFVLIFLYSTALATEFLSTVFYAFLFFCLAVLLVALSAYLLSAALVALVMVARGGVYPMTALKLASNLVRGRRIELILRLLVFVVLMVIAWVLVGLVVVLIDMGLKNIGWLAGVPIVPVWLLAMTCVTASIFSIYMYLVYRDLLNEAE